jgi:transposase-like protein
MLTVLKGKVIFKTNIKMATRTEYKLSRSERQKRVFSEEFKRERVKEIDMKATTVSQVSRTYEVNQCNVRKWMEKYSKQYKKGLRLVVEMESETKKLLELQAKIAELERIVGQKQVLIDFQAKMIEIAEQEFGIDIKKKSEKEPSSTSGSTGKNSTTA